MNHADASHALNELRQSLHAAIPPGTPRKGKRYLGYLIDEQIAAARLHLDALYGQGLEVGDDFAPVESCRRHPKYEFWLGGIRRHIEACRTSVRGNPPDRSA